MNHDDTEESRPLNMHPLVGLWSIDCLYGPGAQEDTCLVFKEDGTGWIEFAHYVVCEVDTIRWAPLDEDHVRIIGDRYLADRRDSPSTVHYEKLGYSIADETTPDGAVRPVVTFAEPLWILETRWGLLRRDVAELEIPEPARLDEY